MQMQAPWYFFAAALLFVARIATADVAAVQASVAQSGSVDEAVKLVSNRLEQQGFTIPLVVDHAAAAASVGLELRPTQVIFARPPGLLERSLLRRRDSVGIDLPFKYLIFEDDTGNVQLRVNRVGYLIDRHNLRIQDFGLYLTDVLTTQFGVVETGLVTVVSQLSLQDTVQALQDAIAAGGAFRIPLVLDFGETKRRKGPVLIVFGNPNAGTPLMQGSREIGIDLPQKFLVSENRDGVVITYNDPQFIAERHNLSGQEMRLGAIANALANFAAAGAGTAGDN